jgi:pyruvate formate lyase activating enzyme
VISLEGIIFDIRRFATHDGPGIRTTVFFKGCPLSCKWCHNPESIDMKPFPFIKKVKVDEDWFEQEELVGRSYSVEEVLKIILLDRVFYEESGGGVTFSGGEPLFQPEFLVSILEACRNEGLHTAVDTSGYVNQKYLDLIIPFTDLFLFDYKHNDREKHRLYTGFSNEIINENLRYVVKTGKKVHVRIPVIPSFNQNENDMLDIMLFLKSMDGKVGQVDLLPYHTLGNTKYKRFGMTNLMEGQEGLKNDDLLPFRHIFQDAGFTTGIGG